MKQVWAVHVLKDVGATFAEVVFAKLDKAEAYASERSNDSGVRGTAITRYTVDELGTRSTVGWFVDGIDSTMARLEREGVNLRGGTYDDTTAGVRSALLMDNDGNTIQLFQPLAR